MVFIHEAHVTQSRGKVKTKRHLFSYLLHAGSECCPNVSVAPNRNKVPHYVHLAGTGCTHLLSLYCSHTWLLQVVSAAQRDSCSKQEQITMLRTFGWYRLYPSGGIILIDGVYS